MCEQTEINYLDGDVVWVKLGACWWPGQVTGFHNLPEDIQHEFKKKPLIAAVKFFQEDTYEFVKNYQQIYKYNCTLKDEFIKKGLDKYRSKSKDGSRYMDKFPGDVEMAEKLTGGDPDILSHNKFCPEEKPNISALFGEKKIPKKKREREDIQRRRSDHSDAVRKITHPRFLKESDHEVRIRQQPSSLPSTPNNTGSPQYPCHLCNFTSSRVNVIICHIKSHRSGNSPMAKSKVKTYSQYRGRSSDVETPKRKYVRKEKSQSNKNKSNSELGKRKQTKQTEKVAKKKKTDPKIRDTILADWDDESDEEINLDQSKSSDTAPITDLPTKSLSEVETEESNQKNNAMTDTNEIIAETEKLLKETERLTSINIMEDSISDSISPSKNLKLNLSDKKPEQVKDSRTSDNETNESPEKSQKEREMLSNDNENKLGGSEKDTKKSLLSCFDFHEEEPSIPPVRKKARAFHQKKEIIKEFEMSQALKTEQEKEAENDKVAVESADIKSKKEEKLKAQLSSNVQSSEESEEGKKVEDENEQTNTEIEPMKEKVEPEKIPEDVQKPSTDKCETQLEIVEIFEVEKDEGEKESAESSSKNLEAQNTAITGKPTDVESTQSKELTLQSESIDNKQIQSEDTTSNNENLESMEHESLKEAEESLSERFTTETEDETVSESADTLPGHSENSDIDMLDQDQVLTSDTTNTLSYNDQSKIVPQVKKRRGRPRKSESTRTSMSGNTSGNESPRIRDNKISQKIFEKFEMEMRTSESDSERSYSGRKRKPNKKYIESDIYLQDVDQKIYKTDESQSESEERVSEKIKGKSKRNKKFVTIEKRVNENIELQEQKELEISCSVLGAAENNINSANKESKDDSVESNACEKQIFMELDTKLTDVQIPVEISEKSRESSEETILPKEIDKVIHSEDTKSYSTEESVIKTEDKIVELEQPRNEKEAENILTSSSVSQEGLKDLNTESVSTLQLDFPSVKEAPSHQADVSKPADMLPPKKSQIKKFELSQIDFLSTDISTVKTVTEPEIDGGQEKMDVSNTEVIGTNINIEADSSLKQEEKVPEKLEVVTFNEVIVKDSSEDDKKMQITEEVVPFSQEVCQVKMETSVENKEQEIKPENSKQLSKDPPTILSEQHTPKKVSMQTRYKGKFTPDTGSKSKKDKELFPEEKATNTFQEAFLKTLQMDKKKDAADDVETTGKGKKGRKPVKKKLEEENTKVSSEIIQSVKVEDASKNIEVVKSFPDIQIQENNSKVTVMSNFEGIEVVVDQNVEIDTKVDDILLQNVDQIAQTSSEFGVASKPLTQSFSTEGSPKPLSLDTQKMDESSRMSTSTPSPSSDVTVPVKKREMPRIIENVALTEPMQILKSKLLDKLPQKGVKHKLEADGTRKGDQKGSPKAKMMKIESASSNTKTKTGAKVASPHLPSTKKIQVLKAEEAETVALVEAQNEQKTPKTPATTTTTEKYIQQSSQSLADMELDINSMPFVLSEDVLTPESIEQMPVVISSIIPASSTIPATLSFTPPTQIVSSAQTQFKATESTGEVSPTKKKSGTPAILKNKSKAKPTITSIKTLVPPLTGGVKGLKFQSAPATSKIPPLLTQKGSPGKYVVVQTSGGQQVRYNVQGKANTQQKVAIPTGKSTGNAQVVQQGGKVVILTSAQSGQTKMLPLNISKTLGGKVQRIMTSKGQVLCPISPQGIINSKTIIAPKGDSVSPTTSKLPAGHKIINTQGIIGASKGVLTPISGTIPKTALLGTLSQGIITKGGIYTPISASALSGKAIIGSKTLVTKGATILSSQNLGTSKAILTPISQALTAKTILSPQGIVSTKATVLTPITGQQVKAIAAKSPAKSSKVQYQSVQQKVQLPMLQKSQKVPMSSSSQGRSGQLKTVANTVVLQNTVPVQKTVQQGKRAIKQTSVQSASAIQGGAQQTAGTTSAQIQQKGKALPTSTVQKVVIPRSGRQTKAQQKIVVQKIQEPAITTVQNIQAKQPVSVPPPSVPSVSKTAGQQKQAVSSGTTTKAAAKGHAVKTVQQQKNLLNIAMNSAAAANVSANLSTPLSLPPLEPIEPERKSKVENVVVEAVQKEQPKAEKFNIEKGSEVEKVEEPKIATQPQIMALPTESSDGTQTYVLVTIDEQGQLQPLDNNTLMSLEGTTQNPDGTRTLYIDPSSLGEAGTLDNIVLQFDNGVMPNIQTSATETTQTIISESFPTSEVIQTSNQDILAAALANTDFQQEINLSENPAGNVMTAGLTQTSLINQTILQSTIIPPTEPISSPSVLETSLTLNQPIMTPLEVPSNLPIQSESTPTSAVSTIPSSLELPITITNPNISYIATGDTQIQISGSSMPDIGEIMENPSAGDIAQTEIPSTQYLVLPNLGGNIAVETQNVQSDAISMPSVSYSVSIPNNIVLGSSQVQTTPSMPIIDDTYTETVQFASSMEPSISTQQTFVDVPVSEMLVSKPSISTENVQSQDITVMSNMIVSDDVPVSSEEAVVSTNEPSVLIEDQNIEIPMQEVYSSQEIPIESKEMTLQHDIVKEDSSSNVVVASQSEEASNNASVVHVQMVEPSDESMTATMSTIDETALVTSDSNVKISPVEHASFEVSDSNEINAAEESKNIKKSKELSFSEQSNNKVDSLAEQPATSNEVEATEETAQILPAESLNRLGEQSMDIDEAIDSKVYAASTIKDSEDCQRDEPSSHGESDLVERNIELHFEETNPEASQERPSQSYEQFGIAVTTDSTDLPSQSATKSENSREPSQSITYEPMETDEEAIVTEPPSQSFEHSKMNEASQSYETSAEESTNAPTQSFNELMQSQDDRAAIDETIDDQTFPTQSYEVGKAENISENLETDTEISQEGNMPSQSNDIGADGIGTSSVSTNNSGLNEDETASSSYVPETPETQERDPDQESAISTSSCEIPPCAELNIASSSAEHTSIHDNGVPEIPTSSYNLNPDISSTHVDSVPTSSYEEQNVSTSYEVPISMPGLEETPSQNFVTESTDHRNEPSSYYAHQEVTASYYKSVEQDANSRLDEDPQEEVTPGYYEGNPQEASQSYFTPEEATPSYSSHNVSPSYYDHRPEGEASQSYYPADDIEKTEQSSSSQNIEASQSFYQERSDELKLRQQGEATPTYTERYPVDYTLENSPIEKHDLVESSVPATRPTER